VRLSKKIRALFSTPSKPAQGFVQTRRVALFISFQAGGHEYALTFGQKMRDPRHLPVEPESPPGCSDQHGYGSLRHVSSVDWFVA